MPITYCFILQKHLKLQKLESLILRITMDEDNRAKGQRARGNAAL